MYVLLISWQLLSLSKRSYARPVAVGGSEADFDCEKKDDHFTSTRWPQRELIISR